MRTLRSIMLLCAATILAVGCQTTSEEADTATTTTFAPLVTTSSTPPSNTTTVPSTTTTSTPTTTTTLPRSGCTVEGIGTDDDFYRRTCEQSDIAIVAAESVDDLALEAAADRIAGLLAERPDLAESVAVSIDGVAVIGQDQRITDLPEFEDIYKIQPGTDWHRLGRSFPGTEEIPVAAGAEENLLCLESDRFEGEDMFVRD
ncbi:MAG: hypothetical protein ACNYZH_02835, partial [Acidimicrobiia bacterium]